VLGEREAFIRAAAAASYTERLVCRSALRARGGVEQRQAVEQQEEIALDIVESSEDGEVKTKVSTEARPGGEAPAACEPALDV